MQKKNTFFNFLSLNETQTVRTRFAPSPTGFMHVGNLRTAIFNYLAAVSAKGEFFLRIEDTDFERNKNEYLEDIYEKLKWIGIQWNDHVVFQSKNFEFYNSIIDKLKSGNYLYFCQCDPTRRETDQNSQVYTIEKRNCDCYEKKLASGVLRFRVNHQKKVTFYDYIRGECTIEGENLEDFALVRANSIPMYNLCVVCDDINSQITHVIRGAEHLDNTHKQVLIYEALGFQPPKFCHLPLILDENKKKLSKRNQDISIESYKKSGILPEALLSYLVRIGWSYKDDEIFTAETLKSIFANGKIQSAPGVFDYKKLLFQNGYFIKNKTWNEMKEILKNYMSQYIENPALNLESNCLVNLYDLLKTRVKTLNELYFSLLKYMNIENNYHLILDEFDTNLTNNEKINKYISVIKTFVYNEEKLIETSTVPMIQEKFNDYIHQNQYDIRELQEIYKVFRILVTGHVNTANIFEIIKILGIDTVKSKISLYN